MPTLDNDMHRTGPGRYTSWRFNQKEMDNELRFDAKKKASRRAPTSAAPPTQPATQPPKQHRPPPKGSLVGSVPSRGHPPDRPTQAPQAKASPIDGKAHANKPAQYTTASYIAGKKQQSRSTTAGSKKNKKQRHCRRCRSITTCIPLDFGSVGLRTPQKRWQLQVVKRVQLDFRRRVRKTPHPW